MSDRIHRFAVISRQLWALLRHELRIVGIILARLREDLRAGRRASLWVCLGYAQKNLAVFLEEYREFVEDRTVDRANPKLAQLEKRVRGLHSLLPREPAYSYSVLIPVYKPDPRYFEESIRSALAQSAPEMEILVGYDGAQPDEVYAVLENLRRELPERAQLVREFRLSRDAGNPGGDRKSVV